MPPLTLESGGSLTEESTESKQSFPLLRGEEKIAWALGDRVSGTFEACVRNCRTFSICEAHKGLRKVLEGPRGGEGGDDAPQGGEAREPEPDPREPPEGPPREPTEGRPQEPGRGGRKGGRTGGGRIKRGNAEHETKRDKGH